MKEIDALFSGGHSPNSKMCVMEAAAYVAGAPWSDSPKCVSPKIAAFLRNWNDALTDNATRTRLLAPLIPEILGTAGSEKSEMKRSWIALDWLVRKCGPAFMDLSEMLKPHAKELRELGPIYDEHTLDAAKPTIEAARKASDAAWAAARDAARAAARAAAGAAARAAAGGAARDAARDAAWAAAWDAARDAAGAAAGGAAWGAAGAAAWDAAGAAAGGAAWGAAGAAAWDAAGAAARDVLAPAVLALQDSAVDLVKHMAEIERTEFKIQRSIKIAGFELLEAK